MSNFTAKSARAPPRAFDSEFRTCQSEKPRFSGSAALVDVERTCAKLAQLFPTTRVYHHVVTNSPEESEPCRFATSTTPASFDVHSPPLPSPFLAFQFWLCRRRPRAFGAMSAATHGTSAGTSAIAGPIFATPTATFVTSAQIAAICAPTE